MKTRITLLVAVFSINLLINSCEPSENEPEIHENILVTNDNKPEIADQDFLINEHSESGTIVGTVVAYDKDTGQAISFKIIEGNEDDGFALDSTTGVLTVKDPQVLDFETSPEFFLKISVSDNHLDEPLESNAVISVHMQNIFEWTRDLYGLVQKGPFINGSQLTVYELTNDLEQTGRSFNTRINNNQGSYEIKNVELNSPYILMQASGFYFNECFGEISTAQLNLTCLVDISQEESTNINIISHLESGRQQALIKKGMSFAEAKAQAQNEILKIFNLDEIDVAESGKLDISKNGDGNSALLAISLILQGYTSVGEMSELIALIGNDILDDGQLDQPELGSALINNARHIKLKDIRSYIEDRYSSLGLDVNIPDFETAVNYFIENSDYVFTGGIQYPQTGAYGMNILDTTSNIEFEMGWHSMAAFLPVETDIRVKVSSEALLDYDYNMPNTGWAMQNWELDFVNTKLGEIDGKIWLGWFDWDPFPDDSTEVSPGGPYTVDVEVFENGDIEPTWRRKITVKDGTHPPL